MEHYFSSLLEITPNTYDLSQGNQVPLNNDLDDEFNLGFGTASSGSADGELTSFLSETSLEFSALSLGTDEMSQESSTQFLSNTASTTSISTHAASSSQFTYQQPAVQAALSPSLFDVAPLYANVGVAPQAIQQPSRRERRAVAQRKRRERKKTTRANRGTRLSVEMHTRTDPCHRTRSRSRDPGDAPRRPRRHLVDNVKMLLARVFTGPELNTHDVRDIMDHRRGYEIVQVLLGTPILQRADKHAPLLYTCAENPHIMLPSVAAMEAMLAHHQLKNQSARGDNMIPLTLKVLIMLSQTTAPPSREDFEEHLNEQFQRVCTVLRILATVGIVEELPPAAVVPPAGRASVCTFVLNPNWVAAETHGYVLDHLHEHDTLLATGTASPAAYQPQA